MAGIEDLSDHDLLIRTDEGVQHIQKKVDALCSSIHDERERIRDLETRMEVAENNITGIKKKGTQDRWIEKGLTLVGTALGIHFGGQT